jgi:hypothetical protein
VKFRWHSPVSFPARTPVDFPADLLHCGGMKGILCILLLTVIAITADAREYKLYAALTEDMPVELSDGAKWMMDKGDVFPILMFKDSQTKVALQLAGANFLTETKRIRILEQHEVPAGLVIYRKNVETYLKSISEKWKAAYEPKKPAADPPKKPD